MGKARRKNIRLKGWDYTSSACYHVTFCTADKRKVLGSVLHEAPDPDKPAAPGQPVESNYKVVLSAQGEACRDSILEAAKAYDGFVLEKFCIMPNHVHMLVSVSKGEAHAMLGTFIGRVKSGATRVSKARGHGAIAWQRGYYDHVIRGDEDYATTWKYIDDNPAKWDSDEYYI